MRISILCTDGSPLGVCSVDLWGKGNRGIGVGGSEIALLTMCEEWHKRGDEVILYNNPTTSNGSPFEQRRTSEYDPNEKQDVLVVFRSPNDRSVITTNCLKVFWSCDQQTIGDFERFSKTVDKIVCISPRHAQFFKDTYGITNTTVIDIPVRMDDYDSIEKPERVKNRLIFTSVPARGLDNLWRIYPIIQKEIPDVSLAITSDYRLWGVGASNEHFRSKWLSRSNVSYFGALPRDRYIIEQLKAQILLYPSCLHPSSVVNTLDGGKPISEISVGDFIFGGYGKVSTVSRISQKEYDGIIREIKILGESDILKLTGDHKVMSVSKERVMDWKRQYPRNSIRERHLQELTPDWELAEKLRVGDYLVISKKRLGTLGITTGFYPKNFYPFVEGENGRLYNHNTRITSNTDRKDGGILDYVPYDKYLGKFFGYYLAEGSASNDATVNFTFSMKEREWAEDVMNLGKCLFGVSASLYERDTYLIVTFSSKALCRLLNTIFGSSVQRTFPNEFMNAPISFKEALVTCYWRGDGSIGKYGLCLSSVSESLAKKMRILMEDLGIISSIRYDKRIKIWVLFVGSEYAVDFSSKIDKKEYVLGNRIGSHRIDLGKSVLVPIKDIVDVQYTGTVYDLGIDEPHHSFLASNVIVHNCYDELFCVAVSESQYAGAYPITSNTGALPTTNMGTVLNLDANNPHNDRAYADATIELLNNPERLELMRREVYLKAKERFNPQKILAQWDDKVFK